MNNCQVKGIKEMAKDKCVLAYSGGLDTSVCIKWLQDEKNLDVIAVVGEVGQEHEGLEQVKQRALETGAIDCIIADMREDFAADYLSKALYANANFENKYPLVSALSRPLISKYLVDTAHKYGAKYVAHGCTGKGNDQVRFELGIKALAPDMKIIAPWRIWDIKSREDELEYCAKHNIELPFKKNDSYSRDRNIWHISHEGLELEDPSLAPNYDHMLVLGVTPEKAPDKDTEISITFEKGVPVALNGEKMKFSEILTKLNELGGKNGIGITDIVENRMVGMKSRGVYETPGGTILLEAHKQLEELILDKETLKFKKNIDNEFADAVYSAKWFSPLREALQAFVESTQEYVTGECKMKLYKGNIIKQGTTSPYSLYNESIASFTTGDLYDHHDASGFINLYGLSTKVRAMKKAEIEKNQNQN